jgi:hypothetical protein
MTDSAIESFLDEVREVGRANGRLHEEHVEIIRTALVNSFNAAGDDPRLLALWDDVREVITDEMGKVAERFDEKQRGRVN